MVPKVIKDFILEVARTPEVINASTNPKHSCNQIVITQINELEKAGMFTNIDSSYQVPEPFSGKIDKAKYLVLGSNPALKVDESDHIYCANNNIPVFPTRKSSDDEICDFFYKRLDHYSNPTYLKYLTYICKWVDEIENKTITKPIKSDLDEKYIKTNDDERKTYISQMALADIVPFKSKKEKGVGEVIKGDDFDTSGYLTKLFNHFNGKYIILCGTQILKFLKANPIVDKLLKDTGKIIYCTPHPRARYSYIEKIEKTEKYIWTLYLINIW